MGALSNPQARLEIPEVAAVAAKASRRRSRVAPADVPPRPLPVPRTVTLVLEQAGAPMRAIEIHAAAERLVGRTVSWTAVKAALSANALGADPRFRRVGHGRYELRTPPSVPPAPDTARKFGVPRRDLLG